MDKPGPNNSKSWLEENLNEMNRSVDSMLKLMAEDDDCLASRKRAELISHVRGFHQIYQSMVENCSRLTGELSKTAPLEFHLDGSDNFETGYGLETPFFTPNQKLKSNLSDNPNATVEISFSSGGGGGSALSSKEATQSSSPSSSDSEPESLNSSFNYDHAPLVSNDNNGLHAGDELKAEFASTREQHQLADVDRTGSILNISIENEELRDMKLKLQLLENEVCRLKSELEKSEPVFQHAKILEHQLDIVQKDLEMKKADLELEHRNVIELQKQTAELKTHVPDCCYKMAKLMDELEEARESLKRSDGEIKRLHHEADSDRKKIFDLNERIAWYEARLSELATEVHTLKVTMSAKQEEYSLEREQLESEILTSSSEVIRLNSMTNDLESRSKVFENKLVQLEMEKSEMEELKTTEVMVLQDEINCLTKELDERRYQVEGLNKEFDRHKHKYDMLMVEKDELKAKSRKFLAEVSSRDDKVLDLERQLLQLQAEQEEVISASKITENTVTELRLQVDELQKEVAWKSVEISDGAEAKKEAIRQLCFSLDHYRTRYQELREAVTSNKRHAI